HQTIPYTILLFAIRRPPSSSPFPYTTLFRSAVLALTGQDKFLKFIIPEKLQAIGTLPMTSTSALAVRTAREKRPELFNNFAGTRDRKSTRLNSSHGSISYAVFCLKKKTTQ